MGQVGWEDEAFMWQTNTHLWKVPVPVAVGRLEGAYSHVSGLWAVNPPGLMISLGELVAAALSGGRNISSLCNQER
jgi:hypothetical protein